MAEYVALGSIVFLNGGIQKVLVISRALNVQRGERTFFFDYAGVPYPEGLVSDRVAYFNNEDIAKVAFMGYRDDDDTVMVDNINRYLAEHPEIVKGNSKIFSE